MNTRRWGFVAVAVLVLMVGALAGSIVWMQNRSAAAAPGPAPSAQIPGAAMPPLAQAPCTLDVGASTRTCEVWAKEGSLTMPDGAVLPTYGFATSAVGPALVPGPVITATQGMTLEVVLHNEIAGETVSLAFPGQEGIVPDLTGVTATQTATYTFGADKAGTFLYEAGLTAGGARQVAMGLAGPLIIEEENTPTWDQEIVLVLNEFDPAFNTDPLGFRMNDFRAEYWVMNGNAYSNTGWLEVAPGTTVLMRYLNAGVEHHTLGTLGLQQQVVATDGEPLPFPQGAVAPAIAPGQTMDTLIEIPAGAENDTLYPLYNASLHQHNSNQRLTDSRAAFGGMLTFLRVTGGGGAGAAGPVASNVKVTPQRTTGASGVQLSAVLTDLDAHVTNYQYYVDNPGTLAGTRAIAASAGTVTVTVDFSSADLDTLSSGEHVMYIRGRDGLLNWGPFGSAMLNLDKSGPDISGMSLHPNPTRGDVAVLVRGTADERRQGHGVVNGAYYRLNGGAWQPMALNRPASTVTALTATVPATTVDALADGGYAVEVRAQDDLGNWSQPYGMLTLGVDKSGPDVLTVTLTPSTLDFSQPYPTVVRLDATIEDPLVGGMQSTLANAEGFVDAQGTPGTGFALYPADGVFDEVLESVYYKIPAFHFWTLPDGTHEIIVVGKDKAGNWGPAGSASISISGASGLLRIQKGERLNPVAPRE